ncbi:MAG: hypothetical protein K8T26_06800 [Lentisphaerae bacterium]|nr:hypothetical protein [Lentisphaerota bacterium]
MDAPEIAPAEQVPPKLVSLQARRFAPEGEAGLLLSGRMSARLERRMAGDFPVLEAFQQFLEQERRRARRHLVVMTSLVGIVLLAVTTLGVYLGTLLHRTVNQDVSKVEAGLQALQVETSRVREETRAQAADVATTAAAWRGELEDKAQAQAAELERYQSAMAAMNAKVASLEQRNETLLSDMESVRKVVPSLTTDMGLVVNMLEDLKSRPVPPVAAPAPRPVEPAAVAAPAPVAKAPVATAEPPGPPLTLALQISPRTGATAIPWRLVIPE